MPSMPARAPVVKITELETSLQRSTYDHETSWSSFFEISQQI